MSLGGFILIVALLAGPPLLAGTLTYRAIGSRQGLARLAIIVACTLSGPLAVLVYAWLRPETKPSPYSIDGPAYVLVGLIELSLLQLPACFVASVAAAVFRHARSGSSSRLSR
jgi:hypothetical protein